MTANRAVIKNESGPCTSCEYTVETGREWQVTGSSDANILVDSSQLLYCAALGPSRTTDTFNPPKGGNWESKVD